MQKTTNRFSVNLKVEKDKLIKEVDKCYLLGFSRGNGLIMLPKSHCKLISEYKVGANEWIWFKLTSWLYEKKEKELNQTRLWAKIFQL